MAIVSFNIATFRARYPEFNSVASATLAACFDEAGLYLDNTESSRVQNAGVREMLLNMLTAHIYSLNGQAVGRVNSGTEGSVSASSEYITPGTHSWFTQTQYGAAFWQATAGLRSFIYIPQRTVWK